jgi:hypothetical protein
MSENPFDDPQWLEYAQHARDELFPMIRDSAVTLSIMPPVDAGIDPKWCLELGAMILLDKPIIAIVPPGTRVPAKLARIADEIVEGGELDSEEFQVRFMKAMDRTTKKIEKRNKWKGG